MFVSLDPVRAAHLKYAFRYALELMESETAGGERKPMCCAIARLR